MILLLGVTSNTEADAFSISVRKYLLVTRIFSTLDVKYISYETFDKIMENVYGDKTIRE